MFVLAHLSDPHLGPLPAAHWHELLSKRGLGYLNWLRKRRAIHRPEVLAAIVADLKRQRVDHLAVTGDLVNLSLGNEFAPARNWLDALGSPANVTFVPGNHDSYVRAIAGFPERHWGEFMRGDAGEGFPFVRRRGEIALIGLSTSVPTLPLAATGRLIGGQIETLGGILTALGREELFRVVLIHHPPSDNVNRFRRLTDATAFREVLRQAGAELVLHGHLHEASVTWLAGPRLPIPSVGVPSASAAPHGEDEPAGYNLYEIGRADGGWRCTAISRGLSRERGGIGETMRTELAD